MPFPLKKFSGPGLVRGHSIQILSVATLQAKKSVYYPNIALIDWLTCYLSSLIPTLGVESHDFAKHFTENAGNFKPETFFVRFLKCPKFRLDVWRMLPGLRPGPSSFLASTTAPFDKKELCSRGRGHFPPPRAAAFGPQAVSPEKPSAAVGFRRDHGAEAEAPRMTNGSLWAAELYARSTGQTNDECFWTQQLRAVQSKNIFTTQSQTHRTSFMAFCFQQITFNETLSIINSLIVCFQKTWKGY